MIGHSIEPGSTPWCKRTSLETSVPTWPLLVRAVMYRTRTTREPRLQVQCVSGECPRAKRHSPYRMPQTCQETGQELTFPGPPPAQCHCEPPPAQSLYSGVSLTLTETPHKRHGSACGPPTSPPPPSQSVSSNMPGWRLACSLIECFCPTKASSVEA